MYFQLYEVILRYPRSSFDYLSAHEWVCMLMVIPEKGVQDFGKGRLSNAKPKWTGYFQEKNVMIRVWRSQN